MKDATPERARQIDGLIEGKFAELMDLQHQIVMYSRDLSQRMEKLADAFEAQAVACREIISLQEEQTLIAAELFGDIIATEQGFTIDDDENSDDDEREDS
jgi:hypothetical protein